MRKKAEFKTTDFSHDNIANLICEQFGELFIATNDISHAIEHGHIKIYKEKFVLKF